MSTATMTADSGARRTQPFTIFSPNPAKKAAEIYYLVFFALSLPVQALVNSNLSFTHYNDTLLNVQAVAIGAGAWFGTLIFRAKEDRGRPFYEVYGFKLGIFLFCWAVIGGYLGTDPWYEVLHGHFAFNTAFNPGGVPFFMLPLTIAVFGSYVTVLGILFRIIWWTYSQVRVAAIPDFLVKAIIFVPLAALMPLLETLYYVSPYYCFDNKVGQWFLNVFIYGSWHYAGLIFFTSFDERPGERQPWLSYLVKGLAAVAIILLLMQLITEWMAPNFTDVQRGARNINDWSANNCLGVKPLK